MLQLNTSASIRTITLDQAQRGNSLSAAMVDALLAAIEAACADPLIDTLVLRGAGRHFCTGFDIADLETQSDGDLLLRFVRIEQVLSALWHAPIRTIAVGQGCTWGAGADLFATCDSRIALTGTTFRFPGAGFGIVLGTRRLAERVGEDTALAWTSGGVQIDADTALRTGLVTEIVTEEELPARLEARLAPLATSRAMVAALRSASRTDQVDRDLVNLVRSCAAPGLGNRIAEYAARAKARRQQ